MTQADRIDAALGRGEALPPLGGVPVAIKDFRQLTSCGVGDPLAWAPLRRWTVKEIMAAPKDTFDTADMGYPGYPLLHNNGCWAADLRDKRWWTADPDGSLLAFHDFPRKIRRMTPGGPLMAMGESEDWRFSKAVHGLGIKSAVTRLVRLDHVGGFAFPNDKNLGGWAADENLRGKWDVMSGEPVGDAYTRPVS